MNSPDPASLQNLNDIVLPAATGWWPLAAGWYFVMGLLLLALTWFVYKAIRRWDNDRYRRAALGELDSIAAAIKSGPGRNTSLRQIPVLLKRVALSAYPRNEVASLSGGSWCEFLNSKLTPPLFTPAIASTLDYISYSTGDLSSIEDQAVADFLSVSRHWIAKHRATVSRNSGRKSSRTPGRHS